MDRRIRGGIPPSNESGCVNRRAIGDGGMLMSNTQGALIFRAAGPGAPDDYSVVDIRD